MIHSRPRKTRVFPRIVAPAILATSTALLASTLPALAQTARDHPAGSPGRFLMQPAEGGILRLDSQTGSLSFCRRAQDGWTCDAVPDERKALEDENKRLKAEVSELRGAITRLEELLGVGENPKSKGSLPTEQDIDRAADYIRGMLKKLREKARDFEEDLKTEPPKRTRT
ncbi:MAG: hypothetical protein RL291_1892 [Pseudomonadota bacterium]